MGVTARCERGYTELLPDLAVWLKRSEPPVAVVAESGGRREDRQKMILEGWRDAILSGRYSGVHAQPRDEHIQIATSRAAPPQALAQIKHPEPPPEPQPETPEEAAERERQYRENFGIPEPKPRRPWRR